MKYDIRKVGDQTGRLTRRNFLGLSATALAGVTAFLAACSNDKEEPVAYTLNSDDPASWWKPGGYIVHESVDTSLSDDGLIRAKVEGAWQKFKVKELPERFIAWSLSERANRLENLAMYGFRRRDLAGPHNACVATFGGPERDSAVSLNTAYKGMGFVPRKRKLSETVSRLKHAKVDIERLYAGDFHGMMIAKTRELGKLYSDKNLFDKTKQVSLELFTTRDYATHTFLNMMVNPIASASFLAFPTFEIRAVPQLLHPLNPDLSEYERGLIAYTNAIHNFIHGGADLNIACIYHIIEVFDDTPNRQAIGKRLV